MPLILSGSVDISGSMTATTIVVSSPGAAGMVSSSAQITELAPLMAYTASLKGAAIVSSSQQITNYYKFAETASANTIFYGNVTASGNFQIGNNTTNAMINISGDNGGGDTFLNFKADSDIIKAQIQGGKNGATAGNLYLKTLKSSVLTTSVTLNHLGDVTIDNGNLVIGTSGKGIDFSATSNGSGTTGSELLNDYEEGTWTPTFTASTSGTITVNSGQTLGKYTKIGRQVTVNGTFTVTSVSSPLGEWRIQGLPFTSAAGANARTAVSVLADGLETTATTSIVGYVDPSVTFITLYKYAAGIVSTLAPDVKAGSYVFVTATYFV
jgi:hypothetical protein